MKKMKILQFDYKDQEEPIDYTYKISAQMQICEQEDFLRFDKIECEEYREENIQKALSELKIDNLRVNLIS